MEELAYSTDIYHQLEDAINFLDIQKNNYLRNSSEIKWMVIGLQNALQCACVFQLDGNDTSQTACLSKNSAKDFFEWWDENSEQNAPKSYLANPVELFKRCKKTNSNELEHLTYSVKKIAELRNKFTHYPPGSWSILLDGFPKLASDTIEAIDTIISMPRMYQHRFSSDRHAVLCAHVQQIKCDLNKSVKEIHKT